MLTGPPARPTRRAPMASFALAALGGVLIPFAAPEAPESRAITPVGGCLWAGTAYAPGTPIVAGGNEYRCGARDSAPYWIRGTATDRLPTVPNPGAATAPTGQFSPGARQPGTPYTDSCVGAQLIPGTDDVYQVVRHPNGTLQWMPATTIAEWSFGPDPRPDPTWRTASLCIDGNLS
ncbi:hypothetical protein Ntsu_36740 [Nocardia sp. IFM 10818]